HRRRAGSYFRPRKRERDRDGYTARAPLGAPERREGGSEPGLRDHRGSPRSRRPPGVGDVPGERQPCVMRAAGISEFGGPLSGIDLPDPRPLREDEVLIEIRAMGVGNWEEFVRTGEWDVGRGPPMALGVEAAGGI